MLGQQMKFSSRAAIVALCGLSLTAGALATTRSSFIAIDSNSGITFSTSNGLTIDVILGANPTFSVGGNTYHITSVIGFYALSDDDDFATINNSDFGVWSTDNNQSGPGGIAGWKCNPNNGFGPNNHQVFTFNALSLANQECVGLHVATSELFPGTTGNTGNIAIVPEPASMAILGLGVVGLVSRRRRK